MKRILRNLATVAALVFAGGFSSAFADEVGDPNLLAVIAHPSIEVEGLSQVEATRIFLAEQQFWPDKTRITLLIRASVSDERTSVLEHIYGMTERQYRKYWIAKMFKAEVASGPKVVYTTDMSINLIKAIPGAVTFVPYSKVPEGVKVLKIDGKLPTDEGYPWAGQNSS